MLDSGLEMTNRVTISAEENDPNCGFQHLKHQFTSQHPCTPESVKRARQPSSLTSATFEFKVSVATSKKELIRHLDVAFSGRAAVWGAEVTGAASYVKDVTFTEETIIVAMTARQITGQTSFDPNMLVLKEKAQNSMDNSDYAGFYALFGSYIPGRITEGATISLFMERTCTNRAEKEHIAASLGAQSGVYKADVSATTKAADTLNKRKFTISAFGKGRATPVPNVLEISASEAVEWAFKTWLQSSAEPTAISTELINVWTLPGSNPGFETWIQDPSDEKDALTEAILDVEELIGMSNYLLVDADLATPAEAITNEIKSYRSALKNGKDALLQSIATADAKVAYPTPESVLELPLGSKNLQSIEDRLDEIETSLTKPVLNSKSEFKLQITGQSVAFIGKDQGGYPQVAMSAKHADVFTFDGVNPVVGGVIRLKARSAGALLRCDSDGQQISYDKKPYDSRKWKILAKRSGGDQNLRIGDKIMIQNVMLHNKNNKNNKAKESLNIGIKEIGGKIVGKKQKSHYLRIVKV